MPWYITPVYSQFWFSAIISLWAHSIVKPSLICGQIWHTHKTATERPTCRPKTIKIDSTMPSDMLFAISKHHLKTWVIMSCHLHFCPPGLSCHWCKILNFWLQILIWINGRNLNSPIRSKVLSLNEWFSFWFLGELNLLHSEPSTKISRYLSMQRF